jgi:hypothetical protein
MHLEVQYVIARRSLSSSTNDHPMMGLRTEICREDIEFCQNKCPVMGRAMAQAVSRRPLTSEAQVRSRISPCGICGTGTGFSPSTSVFLCQFYSTGAPFNSKTEKTLSSSS